ncbi:tetratricopeptide repeat protein, partial [Thiorhodococcus minor]
MSDTNQASDTKSLLAQAVSQHGAGRLDVAEHLYRAVLAVDAADAEACHGLGALLVERGLSEPGLELLRRAVELAPDKAVYWCGLALALLAALRPDEALRVVDRAENLGLELPSARELRTQIQAAISPRGDPGDAAAAAAAVVSRQAREMVAALADAGRLEEAEAAARGLTERHPSDAFGWKALGTIMTQRHCHDAALSVLRRAVALDAGDAESLNSLATALQRVGRLDEAHAFAERAVALRPDYAEAHYNAALILHEQRRFEEALRGYRLAVEIRPNLALAHNNMGNLLTEMGRRDEALSCFSRALAVAPEYADAHNNLGSCLMGLGRTEESLACFAHALAIEPGHAEAHNNQGNALAAIGRVEEALGCYARAVAARPSYAQAYSNAGNALVSLERLEQAVDCYRRAIALAPDFALAHYNLGNTLRDLDQLGEAVEHYRRALSLQPSSADCLSNLGGVLQDLGEVDEAIACRRQALALEPDDVVAYGGLLFTLNYHPDKSAEEIFAAYRDYERRFGAPLRTGWRGHGNDRDPERRLRLGYVSADLRAHSLRSFLEPLLAHHDHGALELIAYAELARGDGVTERYRGWFDHWVDTRGLSDAALAERIRADAVDIL